jgi:hypothetical protein
MSEESYAVCAVCGCRFRATGPRLVCWDCADDMMRTNNAILEKKRVKDSLATICKCPICGRSHIKLERS